MSVMIRGLSTVSVALFTLGACHTPATPPLATGSPSTDLYRGMVRRAELVMGTRLVIALRAPLGHDGSALLRECFAIARRHDRLLSHYRADSPLSRINAGAGAEAQRVPPALYRFLERSRRYARQTSGAFDVTVGALVALYRETPTPTAAALAARRRLAGIELLELDAPDRARLSRSGALLDPGGHGKGFAVDAIVAHLRRSGVERALIDFGGSSFFALGAPAGHRGWPLLLTGTEPGAPIGVLQLRDAALSTSCTIDPLDGHPLRHIVDPRSGELVGQVRFAGAVTASATDAEVLSTALVVDPTLRPHLAARFPRARLVVQRADGPSWIDRRLRSLLRSATAAPRRSSARTVLGSADNGREDHEQMP